MNHESHKPKTENQNQKAENHSPKVCLTIAGLDPSGGAGIIADIKTFTAFDCFATAAVTSLTFQNTTGVFGAVHQTAASVRGQVEPIVKDFAVSALKTGMLPTREIIRETAALIQEFALPNFVVDPVVRSTSGFDLIDDAALQALIENLFPLARVVTPNIPEAERIAQIKIESAADVRRAADIMRNFGAKAVLIKGGHFESIKNYELKMTNHESRTRTAASSHRVARDFLFDNGELTVFEAEFIETTATHGTGCTLAAAIAANLAHGKKLSEAVQTAKNFVTNAIQTAPLIGSGHSPVNTSGKWKVESGK